MPGQNYPTMLVLTGAEPGIRYHLKEHQYTMGRGIGCDLRVPDNEASRLHAVLERRDSEYWITDSDSSNGTIVNGQSVDRIKLRDGDTLQIGGTTLRYTGPASGAESTLLDRVNFYTESRGDEDRSSILSQTSVEEAESILVQSALATSPERQQTLVNLQALYRISEETVNSTHSLEQILQRVLDEAIEAVGAERGCLLLKQPDEDVVEPQAISIRSDLDSGKQIPVSQTIVDYVLRHRQGVRTSDARRDRRFDPGKSILREGIRDAICVPMQGKYDLVGVIYVDRTSRDPLLGTTADEEQHFTEDELHLLMAIGRQSALTVENQRYQQALIQAEKLAAMGQTVAAISHHIKNILQGIRGGTYLIDSGLKNDQNEVIRNGWEIIERNQVRIYNLVLDMLSFSKEREPMRSTARLTETVRDAIAMVRVRAEEAGVGLESHIDDDIPDSYYDEEAIHRAVLNVVTNALDVMEDRETGNVQVTAGYDSHNKRLFVTIADDGPGIPASEREAIFQAFHSTRGARGTGLGLAVSRKIMLEHDGDILLESVVGKGSRFTLSWPVVEIEEDRATGSSIIQGEAAL